MKTFVHGLIAVTLAAALWAGCAESENPLAPYEGHRPLILQRVTQSPTPDIQWVGGRVAAIGVNIGDRAALDETLVWVRTAQGDEIDSYVTVGDETDFAFVEQLGGEPADELSDNTEYTVWLANQEVFDAGLDASADPAGFADTTVTLRYVVRGRAGRSSNPNVDIEILRDERLLGDRFTISWDPAVPIQRLAIRHGAGGGFTDLVWHIVSEEDAPESILPPLVVGEAPPNTVEAVEWAGFESVPDSVSNHIKYMMWMVTQEWSGERFSDTAPGYTSFGIFSDNFKE